MKYLILLSFCCLFSCSTGVTFSEHSVGNGRVTTLSYPADKRAANILYRPSDREFVTNQMKSLYEELKKLDCFRKETKALMIACEDESKRIFERIGVINSATASPFIISEPPAQVSFDSTSKFIGSLNALKLSEGFIQKSAKSLFNVSHQNIAIRDALYRLNEAYFFGFGADKSFGLSSDIYQEIFEKIISTASQLSNDANLTMSSLQANYDAKKNTLLKAEKEKNNSAKILDSVKKNIEDIQEKLKSLEKNNNANKKDPEVSKKELEKKLEKAKKDLEKADKDLKDKASAFGVAKKAFDEIDKSIKALSKT